MGGGGDVRWNQPDERAVPESRAQEREQRAVELVRARAHLGQDLGVVFGDVGRDLLLHFLRLARFARVRDRGVEGVLSSDDC